MENYTILIPPTKIHENDSNSKFQEYYFKAKVNGKTNDFIAMILNNSLENLYVQYFDDCDLIIKNRIATEIINSESEVYLKLFHDIEIQINESDSNYIN